MELLLLMLVLTPLTTLATLILAWKTYRLQSSKPVDTRNEIDRALDSVDERVRRQAMMHPNATPAQILRGLKDLEDCVAYEAVGHPNMTEELIDLALDRRSDNVDGKAFQYPIDVRAIRHPKATFNNLMKALRSTNIECQQTALRHPKITAEHVAVALESDEICVRRSAVYSCAATQEQLAQTALYDTHSEVREAAKEKLIRMRSQNPQKKA